MHMILPFGQTDLHIIKNHQQSIIVRVSDLHINKKQQKSSEASALDSPFTILFYAYPVWFIPKSFNFDKCSYRNCKLTADRKLLSTSQAVIFHHNSFTKLPKKPNGQIWIFATLENPYLTFNRYKVDKSKRKFNWTMTYRKDSEGFSPYVVLKERIEIPVKNYTSIYMKKTKNIAWITSNCRTSSKREDYVKELSKYIDVDIYGKCGKPCLFKEYCKTHLSKTHRFYLSFENALCKDYLTEKVADMYDINKNFIPIVRGAPNAGDYLPQRTYISTSDFESPKKLATFLKILGRNETRYISYLKEKDKYVDEYGKLKAGLCDICSHLNVKEQQPKTMNLSRWLWENQCHMQHDIPT
ncbi:glycoprotein 3-alpha-L-fucosyltransferase A-like [Mytilus trossulus]|uniref:glycoprotein 3-alpha-L-fucosyltransferase A-like n=1 Tax=Mytilus trossulus TaxID=6551 RepID=UPI003006184B